MFPGAGAYFGLTVRIVLQQTRRSESPILSNTLSEDVALSKPKPKIYLTLDAAPVHACHHGALVIRGYR